MPEENDKPKPSTVPRGAAMIMIGMLAAFALLSVYANVQRSRREKVETVIVTRPTPAPSATPEQR